MEKNIIKFHSCHPSNKNNKNYKPSAVKNHIPNWFLEKDKFKKNDDGEYQLTFFYKNGKSIVDKIPTWKSCPALLDVFTSGYYLFTPCDIKITLSNDEQQGSVPVTIEYDKQWGRSNLGMGICHSRGKEEGLPHPDGYHEYTYVWVPNWFVEVPNGYTTFVSHPININNLPFKTVSGFIDASNPLTGSGNIPFYIKEGWEGTIPAGTPYAQIIPIRNEEWVSEIIDYTDEELDKYIEEKHEKYMVGSGLTKYKELDWLKKHYE